MIGEPPSLAGGVQVRSIFDAETAFADRPVGRDGTLTDGVVVVVAVVVVAVVVTVVVTVVVAVVVVDEAVEVEVVAVVVVVVAVVVAVVVVVVEVVVVVVDVEVPQFMTAVMIVSILIETVLGLLLPPSNQRSKEQEPNPLTERLYDWPLLRVYVAGVNPLATVTPF